VSLSLKEEEEVTEEEGDVTEEEVEEKATVHDDADQFLDEDAGIDTNIVSKTLYNQLSIIGV
jgi:hypothetical protein